MAVDGVSKETMRLLRLAERWCPCGSGGGMACDENCAGQSVPPELYDVIRLLIERIRLLETAGTT